MTRDSQIPNYGSSGTGPRLQPGMTFAIEPITLGDCDIRISEGRLVDLAIGRSLAAHFEH